MDNRVTGGGVNPVNTPAAYNHNQMIRDIRDSLRHLRREPENPGAEAKGNQVVYGSNSVNSSQHPPHQGRFVSARNNFTDANRGHQREPASVLNYDESGYSSSSSECSTHGANDINGQQPYAPGNIEDSLAQNLLSPSNFDFVRAMVNNNGYQRINPNAVRNRDAANPVSPSVQYPAQSPPPYMVATQRGNRAHPESQAVSTHRTSKTQTSKYMQTTAYPSGNKMISTAEWKVTSDVPGRTSPAPRSMVPQGGALWQSTPYPLNQKTNQMNNRPNYRITGHAKQTTSPQFQVQVSLNTANGTQGHVTPTNFCPMVSQAPVPSATFQVSVKTSHAPDSDRGNANPRRQHGFAKTDGVPLDNRDPNYDMMSRSNGYPPRGDHHHPPPYQLRMSPHPAEVSSTASQVFGDQDHRWRELDQWTRKNAPQSDTMSVSSDESRTSTIEEADFSGFELASLTSFDGMEDAIPTAYTNETGTLVVHVRRRPEHDVTMSDAAATNGQQRSQRPYVSPQTYKFYLEQRMENVIKDRKEREQRREQLEIEMQKVQLSEDAQSKMRKILSQKESNYIRLKRSKMDPSMFDKVKMIGLGAFGEVNLVKKRQSSSLYAMKILKKAEVLKRNQVAHVKAERDILAEADNEWVVKLYYSFQDKENLYFVMEYVPGGDLMSLLIKKSVFPEDMARFYVAELVLAIESVHRMGFIHRDIKPDNVLIDSDGHIKLTDFGLCTGFRWTHDSKYYQCGTLPRGHSRESSLEMDDCWAKEYKCRCGHALDEQKTLPRRHVRQHKRCQAHSLVGTPNYIAPEVLMRIPYTHLCDWWSVGVILYEMLVGRPPFYSTNAAETQMKVINWESTLHIPRQAELTSEAEDLILRLCTSADHRIGRGGTDDIKNHSFFHGIDWVMIRRTKAYFVPHLAHPEDTSNFDPVEPERPQDSDCQSMTDVSENAVGGSHAFYEFTFRRFFNQDQARSSVSNYSSLDETEGEAPVFV